MLKLADNDPRLGYTEASTVYVQCIFVGPNENRRDQWIFYISIASTSSRESAQLLRALRQELGEIVRID